MSKIEKLLSKFLSKEIIEKLTSEEATDSDVNAASIEIRNKYITILKEDPEFTKAISDPSFSAGRVKTLEEISKHIGLDTTDLPTIKERINYLTKQSDPESLKSTIESQIKAREAEIKLEYEKNMADFQSNLKMNSEIERYVLINLSNQESLIPPSDVLELAVSKLTNSYNIGYTNNGLVIKNLDGSPITTEDKLTQLKPMDVVANIVSPYIKKKEEAPLTTNTPATPIEPTKVIINRNEIAAGHPLSEQSSYFANKI